MTTSGRQSTPRSQDWERPFPLLRYFSIASLVCTLVTAVALGLVYRQYAVNQLVAQAERESTAFAEVLSFMLRHEIATLLERSGKERDVGEVVARIDRMIRAQAGFFNAAKVKIYTRDGMTVYSTVKDEIGRSQADNPGVVGALRGEVVSNIVYRERFNAFDRVEERRDLLQTYLRVARNVPDETAGVFELYSDITALLARIHTTEILVMVSVVGMLLLMYAVLFAIMYRAHRIIALQDQKLKDHVQEINRYNVELEDRVHERTEALEMANLKLRSEIRERVAAEEELEQARLRAWQQDKLAAIGRLAAGIVHEFGNPLAALDGLVDQVREALTSQQKKEVEASFQLIRENIRRLESITHDVSEFSIPTSGDQELVNLNEVVARVMNVVNYDSKFRDLKMVLDLDHDLPAVSVVPDQLMQVLMNLVLNAADAIEKKKDADRMITVTTHSQGDQVVVTVRDQGEGMNEETLAKAFEPFQTSKAPGKGMGIGLSLCYSIVRSHGGEIDIDSQPQVGTTVSVALPLPHPAAS